MPRNRYTKAQIDTGKKRLKSIRQKLKTRPNPPETGALGVTPCSARGVNRIQKLADAADTLSAVTHETSHSRSATGMTVRFQG